MNKSILSNVLMFAAGAVIGSAVTYKLVWAKADQTIKEETQSVKDAYAARLDEIEGIGDKGQPEIDISESRDYTQPQEEITIEDIQNHIADIHDYTTKVADYTSYDTKPGRDTPKEVKDVDAPYIIQPREYGEFEDYELVSLTYYEGDKVLTDDMDEIIDDADDIVGCDFSSHFGEREEDPDSVYIRNDRLKCDYEILLDVRAYSNVFRVGPYHAEDE